MRNTKIVIMAGMLIGLAGMQLRAEEGSHAENKKTDTYPLTTCVVSGEALGEMGEPYIYDYEGREVRFCCKGCKKDFLKEPAKFLAKLDAAEAEKAKGAKSGDSESHMEGNHHTDSNTSTDAASDTSGSKKDDHKGHHH